MIWAVRDFDFGKNMPFVTFWSECPARTVEGSSNLWLAARPKEPLHGYLGALWIWDAWRVLGTAPDDFRQVIVADRDPAHVRRVINQVTGVKVPKP